MSTFLVFKKHLWAFIVLPLSLLVTFFPVLFGGKVLLPTDMIDIMTLPYSANYHAYDIQNHYVNDAILQYYPYKALTKKAWEDGRLTYWNPNILCGYPQSSETMSTNFDPFNIILLFGDMPGSYHWQIVLQLLFAGIGMYILLTVRKISPLTSTLFASAYMLNGMFIGLLMHRWMVGAFCWLPFTLAALYVWESRQSSVVNRLSSFKMTTDDRRLTMPALAAITLAFGMMGGNVQTSVFLIFIVASVMLFEHIGSPTFWSALLRTTGVVIAAICVSAVLWFPVLELFKSVLFDGGSIHSSSVHRAYTLINRLWTLPLLGTFFMPQLAGGPLTLHKLANAYTIDFSGSIAFIPLLAGLIGIVRYRKVKGLRVYCLLAVLSIALPIATPLYSFLYHRFFIVFFISAIILGAHVVDSWFSQEFSWDSLRKWFRVSLITYAVVVAALLTVNIVVGANKEYYLEKLKAYSATHMESAEQGNVFHDWIMKRCEDVFTHYSLLEPTMYVPLLTIGISLLLLYLMKRNGSSGSQPKQREAQAKSLSYRLLLLRVGFILTTVIQLGVTARWWLPMNDPSVYPLYPKTDVTDFLLSDSTHPRIYSPSVPPKEQFVLVSNVNNMYGIADIRGFESLVPRSYATFQEYWRNPDTLNARLLGLFNTKYILTGTQMIQDTSLELTRDGAVKIYNNKMIRPRAFMAYKWKIVPNDSKAIRIMEDSSFDGSTVLFHNTVGNNTEQSDSANSEVRIISQEDNSIRLRVTTDKPGFLVLSDTYYPGWHTTVNGKPEEILRANYCMRSVLIPAGESDVKMYFAPHSALWGKWISAGSLVLLFAFVLMSVKRNKSHDNA